MKKEINTIPWKLIIGSLKQELTKEEISQFEQWIAVPKNTALFEEIRILWTTIQTNYGTYIPDKDRYWKKLSLYVNADRAKQIKKPRQSIRWIYKSIAVACTALLMGISFYVGSKIYQVDTLGQEYTSLGGKSKIILPDGSLIWLNAHSSLSYDSNFLKTKRVVKLSGEAYFDVAHNESLPFVVNADGVDIKVHGTKFDVESFNEDDYVQVSLQQGAISMYTKDEVRSLRPGEQGIYHKDSGKMTVTESDVDFAISWAQDKLEFNNRSLEDICRFLSKWYRIKIEIHPSLIGQYNYTFILRNEPLEDILRLMSKIHPLTYQFGENNILYLTPLKNK